MFVNISYHFITYVNIFLDLAAFVNSQLWLQAWLRYSTLRIKAKAQHSWGWGFVSLAIKQLLVILELFQLL